MKKALALSVFTLVMSLPLVSSAASVSNSFLSSTSGTASIAVSDTIQFEVTITTDLINYNTILWSLTGDSAAAVGSTAGSSWAGVSNIVTNWAWHFTPAGGGKVKMGTNGRISPSAPAIPTPDRVSGPYGFFGTSKTGDGNPALVGTVTIHADAVGTFAGGGFQYPGVDGFLGSGGGGTVPVSGGAFTVVPEPGSALLMAAGLVGLAAAGRRKNA